MSAFQTVLSEEKAKLNKAKHLIKSWGIDLTNYPDADDRALLEIASVIEKLQANEDVKFDLVDMIFKAYLEASQARKLAENARYLAMMR